MSACDHSWMRRQESGGDSMPGFDTLGARLARSRRRLERERAAVSIEQLIQDGRETSVLGDEAPVTSAASMPRPASAQVIRFPRLNGRAGD